MKAILTKTKSLAILLLTSLFIQCSPGLKNEVKSEIRELGREEIKQSPHIIPQEEAIYNQANTSGETLQVANISVKPEVKQEKLLLNISKLDFEKIPPEMQYKVLAYLSSEEMKTVRNINRYFYSDTTGYDTPGVQGINNKPSIDVPIDKWGLNNRTLIFEEMHEIKKSGVEKLLSFPYHQLIGVAEIGTKYMDVDADRPDVDYVPEDLGCFVKELELNVHTLRLGFVDINTNELLAIAEALKNKTLKRIELRYIDFSNPASMEVVKNLPTTLKSFKLNGTNISPTIAAEITTSLKVNNPSLLEVDLSGNFLGDELIISFIDNLPRNLNFLELSRNNISAVGLTAIAENLKEFPQLQYLGLGVSEIDDVGAIKLLNNLPASLLSLNLFHARVTDEGINAIVENLKQLTRIQYLGLSGIQGKIIKLVERLNELPTLEYLNLTDNKLGDKGLQTLLYNLPANLKKIELYDNNITVSGITHFAINLHHPAIEWIDLDNSAYDVENIHQFANNSSPNLKVIVLRNFLAAPVDSKLRPDKLNIVCKHFADDNEKISVETKSLLEAQYPHINLII